jgi:hypothetical protein
MLRNRTIRGAKQAGNGTLEALLGVFRGGFRPKVDAAWNRKPAHLFVAQGTRGFQFSITAHLSPHSTFTSAL